MSLLLAFQILSRAPLPLDADPVDGSCRSTLTRRVEDGTPDQVPHAQQESLGSRQEVVA